MLVSAVMVGLAPYTALRGSAGADGRRDRRRAQRAGGANWWLSTLKGLVEIGALAGLTSVMTVNLMAQPRDLLRHGERRPAAGRGRDASIRAGRRRTCRRWSPAPAWPWPRASRPVDVLGHLVSIGTLFAFVVVSLGVLVLRRTRPDLPRPFRVPLVPYLPIASVVVCLALMASLPWETWERLIVWMAVGMADLRGCTDIATACSAKPRAPSGERIAPRRCTDGGRPSRVGDGPCSREHRGEHRHGEPTREGVLLAGMERGKHGRARRGRRARRGGRRRAAVAPAARARRAPATPRRRRACRARTTTRTRASAAHSASRYGWQAAISSGVGALSGGAQRTAATM